MRGGGGVKNLPAMTNEVNESVKIFDSGQSHHDLWKRQRRNQQKYLGQYTELITSPCTRRCREMENLEVM
jgi:hypothetical protein